MMIDVVSPELPRLMAKLVDNLLEPSEAEMLRDLLASSAVAQRYYYSYLDLHVELGQNCDHAVYVGPSAESIAACQRTIPSFPRSLVRAALNSTWSSVSLVAILVYGGFAMVAWNLHPERVPHVAELEFSQSDREVVATITAEQDCVWRKDSRQEMFRAGRRLRTDEAISLHSGVAQLTFAGGASVVIEGPCHLELRTTSKGYLRRGKLAAHVPPQAKGFEMETPTARVVDLGTDFNLEVNPEGTRLAVIAGKVDLFPVDVSANGKQRITRTGRRIEAGEALAITATANGASVVREAIFDATRLSEVSRALPHHRLPSPVVAFQVSENAAGNQRDFHGGVGLDFDVRVPIRVYSLGVFDHLGDGIDPATSPTVQLWSRDLNGTLNITSDDVGREVLAEQVFTPRDSGELKLGHRFKPLSKPIELPVGSYSIVAYGLAETNPFITFEDTNPAVDFSNDPGWTGLNNATGGNHFGWSPSTNHAGGALGEVGGAFARCHSERSYGDTALSQTFTLRDTISASGSFRCLDFETMDGQFFVGHYSSSAAGSVREFIGMEFMEGGLGGIRVRVRMNLREGNPSIGATSSWIDLNARENYHFEYIYDPTYEADGSHNGPEGKVTLRVHSEGFLVNQTVAEVLEGSHRDFYAVFDAFGMGIATAAVSGDDATKTVRAFIDNVSYSGFQGKEPLSGVSEPLSSRKRFETWHGSIIPTGSRSEECEPDTFPRVVSDKKIGYAAGSFEYCRKIEGSRQRAD
jgi:hypothetical protein